jgi:hypothetical protein
MRRTSYLAAAVLLFLVANAGYGYVVYLKDGSRLEVKGKYEVQGENAILTMPSGTKTSLKLSEIDIERTDEANQDNYGDALVLERGEVKQLSNEPVEAPEKPTLSDMAQQGVQPHLRRPAARPKPRAPVTARTREASSDLMDAPRDSYPDLEAASEARQIFHGQGIDDVKVFAGTAPTRMLLEFTTNSEASVFRALETSAVALLQLQEKGAGGVQALELVMVTERRTRGGSFVMTPELATELATKQIEVPQFFLRYVRF